MQQNLLDMDITSQIRLKDSSSSGAFSYAFRKTLDVGRDINAVNCPSDIPAFFTLPAMKGDRTFVKLKPVNTPEQLNLIRNESTNTIMDDNLYHNRNDDGSN